MDSIYNEWSDVILKRTGKKTRRGAEIYREVRFKNPRERPYPDNAKRIRDQMIEERSRRRDETVEQYEEWLNKKAELIKE